MLDHPAYDCVYLALARVRALRFVTADTRLVRKFNAAGSGFEDSAVPLGDALSLLTKGSYSPVPHQNVDFLL